MAVTVSRNLGYLGFTREAAQGTPLAPTSFVKLQKQLFMISQEFEDIRNGNVTDINNSVKKYLEYKGSVQSFLYPDEGGRLLAGVMGKDTISGAGDPWTHTLTLLDNIPFYTFEADWFSDGLVERVTDCKLDQLKITGKAGELIDLDFNLMGCNPIGGQTPATVTFTDTISEGPMRFLDGVFTLAGPTDAAVVQGQITDFQLTINRNIMAVKSNSLTPIILLEGVRKFDLQLSAAFSGNNLYNLTHNGSSAGVTASPIAGTGSLTLKFTSQAAPEHSISITINNFSYQHATPSFSKDGNLAIITANAVGYRSGATLPMTAIVKNAISSAYTA